MTSVAARRCAMAPPARLSHVCARTKPVVPNTRGERVQELAAARVCAAAAPEGSRLRAAPAPARARRNGREGATELGARRCACKQWPEQRLPPPLSHTAHAHGGRASRLMRGRPPNGAHGATRSPTSSELSSQIRVV